MRVLSEQKKVSKMFSILIIIILAIFAITKVRPDPTGGVITVGNSSRGTNPNPQTANAQAGNVTQLNINASRITEIWQGFFGNISGQITLENSAGSRFYDWSISQMTGEVYGTRNTITSWSEINCTNSSQWEAEETLLNIPSAATDGVNETYNATSHPGFLVGTRLLTGCRSTRPYNSTGQPGEFWNVLLNSNSTNLVYTSILADNSNGFDNTTVDFELMVPTDRASGTATYYFYAELN